MIREFFEKSEFESFFKILPQLKRIDENKTIKELDVQIAKDVREDFESLFVVVYTEDTSYLNLYGETIQSPKGRALSIKITNKEDVTKIQSLVLDLFL